VGDVTDMDLFFLRHGKAFERSPKFRPDSMRPLTPGGEKEMKLVARGIKRLDVEAELILTSPYVRATKTAEIFHNVVKCGKLRVSEALISETDPAAIIDEIAKRYSHYKSIVLVGHEPHMSNLMSLLLTGDTDTHIDFKKAGFGKLCIDRLTAGKCACLKWLMTPRQLTRLYKPR
jgi:phosphohistidine phosphatase